MPWLYVDDKRILFRLGQRRLDVTKRGIYVYQLAQDDPFGAYRPRSLEFEVEAYEEEALPPLGGGWLPLIVGDKECPPTGVKPTWVFHERAGENYGVYGPHDNGPHTAFFGLIGRTVAQTPWRAGWVPQDNALTCGESDETLFPSGQAPGCAPGVGTGLCTLPPAGSVTTNDIYWEFWCDPDTRRPSGNYDYYQQCVGNLWQRRNVSCEPPRRVYFPVFGTPQRHEDRKRVPQAKTVRVPFVPVVPLVPPPFVFGMVAGVPGPPTLSEGGFRPRNPPRSRTREPPKRKGTIGTIMKILDIVSETAEIVDCVYGTLPKATRKRWEKGRPNRGLLDQAGQYGIDGADWKSQAIWHNYMDVDWGKALDCAAVNQIEDAIIGRIQANLPKGAGTAVGRTVSQAEYYRKREQMDAMWARIAEQRRANVQAAYAKRRRARAAAQGRVSW